MVNSSEAREVPLADQALVAATVRAVRPPLLVISNPQLKRCIPDKG